MLSPFPGMDPYLEHPELWPEVHHRLITAIAIAIAPPIRPKYRVAIEKRTYMSEGENTLLVGIPDASIFTQQSGIKSPTTATATLPAQTEVTTVTLPIPYAVREAYLEIREVATSKVVTVIEILSPTNKRSGRGQQEYQNKRIEILSSVTHLVEIDLLRGGQHTPILSDIPATDYRILVARGDRRPLAQFYGFSIRQIIPQFILPLQPGDTEPIIDLQGLLAQVYEQAGFDMAVDYTKDPLPPLKSEDQTWVDILLRETGLR